MPFTTDFNATPVGSRRAVIREHTLKEPLTRYGVSAQWSRQLMNEVARQAGMTNVYYMDMEEFSLLLGIYRRRSLVMYGE